MVAANGLHWIIMKEVLTQPLIHLKGIGPERASLMAQKGLHTILDLLFFTPIRYEDRREISSIRDAREGIPVLVKGRVAYGRGEGFTKSRKRPYKILIRDDSSLLELIWFHYKKPYMDRLSVPNRELMAYGTVTRTRGKCQMVHPEITFMDDPKKEVVLGFYPVYSSIKGISINVLRTLIRSALDTCLPSLMDPIPRDITRLLGLPDLPQAIKNVHFPPHDAPILQLNRFQTLSHKRLLFDRFFLIMLVLAYRKEVRKRNPCPIFQTPPHLMEDLKRFFPFQLTAPQLETIEEMVRDLVCGKPMNRLIMGDVGCGKTVVAAVAAYLATSNNTQVALMVPTQVLADQHMETFSGLSDRMGFRPLLLTGNVRKAERLEHYHRILDGSHNLVIGTHSLIQKGVSFKNLGLVIIDEQHRFGVRERALMEQKGENPHILVMTATPIPRTLALTIYGDMDISIIKGYPKGHRPAVTNLIEPDQKRIVFQTLLKRISSGQQAFVICPMIEGSEEMDLKNAAEIFGKLKGVIPPPYRVGLIHGRLAPEERADVMEAFRKGRIHILVGTTVIEVGVHVPKATIMIIEHPERFGLAQLHQLRGRVGRGSDTGLCFLMMPPDISPGACSRLKILAENADGFAISSKDLELRGQGEWVGMRQAGLGEIDLSDIMQEPDLLSEAKREAERLIGSDPELSQPPHLPLRNMVWSILKRPLDL